MEFQLLGLFVAPPLHPATQPHDTRNMEDDRAATNLGPEVDEGISEEPTVAQKQPRRRFVGRKTAETAGEQQADPNANIEDSSAIQGVRRLHTLFNHLLYLYMI
jgi:hypothetical protein